MVFRGVHRCDIGSTKSPRPVAKVRLALAATQSVWAETDEALVGDIQMIDNRPARAGIPIADADTPALALDMPAFTRNLEKMQAELTGSGVAHRAHGKAHKCPDIARRQLALGAVGVCCQKVSEAEVFVDAGIDSVVVTNEVVCGRQACAARSARTTGRNHGSVR